MSSKNRGTTAFDRLRARLDAEPHVCESCGCVDDEGSWTAVTSGARVVYERECPSCGDRVTRDYRL